MWPPQTSPSLQQNRVSILASAGSCMVISFLNLMANHKAETICACLHFSCYMMVAWCLHEHVATLRVPFPLVWESVYYFFFFSFHFVEFKAPGFYLKCLKMKTCVFWMWVVYKAWRGLWWHSRSPRYSLEFPPNYSIDNLLQWKLIGNLVDYTIVS